MKKILLAILLVGMVGSVFIINEANAAASGNGIKATIESVMATLISHEERISSIEGKTSTVVANSQVPSLLSASLFSTVGEGQCEVLVTDSEPITEYVRGWCPDPSYTKYLIEDARVVPESLVITNIQNVNAQQEGIAPCIVSRSGDFVINGTFTVQNAFLLDCTGPIALTATHTLIYAVFN